MIHFYYIDIIVLKNLKKLSSILVFLCILPLFSCQTSGTSGPWLNQSGNEPWSIQSQSEIVRSGETAYRFEVRPGDGWGDGFKKSSRAEFSERWNASLSSKNETWYGMSLFIPKEIEPSYRRLIIGQWHGTKHYIGWCNRAPILANEFLANDLVFRIAIRYETEKKCDPNSNNPNAHIETSYHELSNFKLGRWNDLIYQVHWSTNDDGYLNVWLNGEKKIEYKGPIGYFDPEGPYFKYGIYRKRKEVNTHIVFFDSYRRGYTYEHVDPAQDDK